MRVLHPLHACIYSYSGNCPAQRVAYRIINVYSKEQDGAERFASAPAPRSRSDISGAKTYY